MAIVIGAGALIILATLLVGAGLAWCYEVSDGVDAAGRTGGLMARIVTYVRHYKRPPKKRKAVALEVPAVVTRKRASLPAYGKPNSPLIKSLPHVDA